MTIHCEIEVFTESAHLNQLFTGFSILNRIGFLKLKQTFPLYLRDQVDQREPQRFDFDHEAILKVRINNQIDVIYDVHDNGNIDENLLESCHYYFKRSYSLQHIDGLKYKSKIFPLGLNYAVTTDYVDRFRLERSRIHKGIERFKSVTKALRLDRLGLLPVESYRIDKLHSPPNFELPSRVIFMVRTWDPESLPDTTQKNVTIEMNKFRVECVRALRAEFGQKFYGGVAVDEYSREKFPEFLLADDTNSRKSNYIEILKGFPVCITTSGLFGSNGWKLAEYVSFSKAIVTEPLRYGVPGGFRDGKNYLSFNNPDELIDQTNLLMQDREMRYSMMIENWSYYQNYVRPDSLILNSIKKIFNTKSTD